MSAAETSRTGFNVIPWTDRAAGPTRRPTERSPLDRVLSAWGRRRMARRAWLARVAAERIAEPAVGDPRDEFARRHPDSGLRGI